MNRKGVTLSQLCALVALALCASFAMSAMAAPSAAGAASAPAPRFRLEGPSEEPTAAARKQAGEHEKRGKLLAEQDDCNGALVEFQAAYRLSGSLVALARALECHEKLGQLLQARDVAEQLLEATPESSKDREDRARKAAELDAQTALIGIRWPDSGGQVSLDGDALTAPNQGEPGLFRIVPGKHRIEATQSGYRSFATERYAAPGKSIDVTIELVKEVVPPAVDRKQVTDFCYMTIKRSKQRSHKQRLVLFQLAGRDLAFAAEPEHNEKGDVVAQHRVLQNVAIDGHLKSTFLSSVLLDQFYTVEAGVESPASLAGKQFVPDEEMISAAGMDSFAGYSLACTDWVALPRITEKSATWRKVKVERDVNGQKTTSFEWQLDVVWNLEADVYKREPGGFKLRQTVEGSNGGALGVAYELAVLAPQKGQGGADEPPALSKRPEPGCQPPLLPEVSKLVGSMTDCVTSATALAEQAERALADEAKDPGASSTPTSTPPVEHREQVVNAAMTEEEQELLKGLAAQDPEAAKRLLQLGVESQNFRVLDLAASAKGTVGTCQEPLTQVSKAAEELRNLSQKGPTALGFQAAVGLASCAGVDFYVDLSTATPPGTSQLKSKFCQGIQRDVAQGQSAMNQVAVCESRVALERATLALQKEVRQLDDIRLFVIAQPPLPGAPDMFRLALGREEGVDRGDLFVAMIDDGSGRFVQSGFGRVQFAGPGGDAGEQEPSTFKFRTDAGTGETRLEAHPQIGVPLAVRPQASYYVIKGDLETDMAFGGAVVGGYNASKFVPVGDEVWGRASVGASVGSASEVFVNIDAGPEIVHYIGSSLAAFAGSGMGFVIVSKSVEADSSSGTETSESYSGAAATAYLGGGLEYAINPDWGARLSLEYRQGLGKLELENEAGTEKIDAGALSAVQAGVAAGYTF